VCVYVCVCVCVCVCMCVCVGCVQCTVRPIHMSRNRVTAVFYMSARRFQTLISNHFPREPLPLNIRGESTTEDTQNTSMYTHTQHTFHNLAIYIYIYIYISVRPWTPDFPRKHPINTGISHIRTHNLLEQHIYRVVCIQTCLSEMCMYPSEI